MESQNVRKRERKEKKKKGNYKYTKAQGEDTVPLQLHKSTVLVVQM
jgi:hypothetical protein